MFCPLSKNCRHCTILQCRNSINDMQKKSGGHGQSLCLTDDNCTWIIPCFHTGKNTPCRNVSQLDFLRFSLSQTISYLRLSGHLLHEISCTIQQLKDTERLLRIWLIGLSKGTSRHKILSPHSNEKFQGTDAKSETDPGQKKRYLNMEGIVQH